jgi:hypothetical protein
MTLQNQTLHTITKQCVDMVRLVLRRQIEIIDKEHITKEDMDRAKLLSDILGTVGTLDDYYNVAPGLHRTPMQKALDADRFGMRPGSRVHTLTPEEEEQTLKDMAEDVAAEEAELKALKAQASAEGNYSVR